MTQRQKDLLDFIRQRLAETGVAPSFEEMASALNLKSKSGVLRLVSALVERGYIHRVPNRARAITMIDGRPLPHLTTDELLDELRRRQAA